MRSDQQASEIISDCMDVHGIKDVHVKKVHDSERQYTDLIIYKDIDNKRISYRHSATNSLHGEELEDISKHILKIVTERAAQKFKKELTQIFEWKHGRIKVSIYDGGWAKCCTCGTRVEIEPQRISETFSQDAECSTPNPLPKSPSNIVDGLSDSQRVLFRMYLIGKCETIVTVRVQVNAQSKTL
jgi:hypothetical protein